MSGRKLAKAWKTLGPMVPQLLLAALSISLAVGIASCRKPDKQQPGLTNPALPPVPAGPVRVRVLLTPSPLAQAAISANGPYTLHVQGTAFDGPQGAGVVIGRSNGQWIVAGRAYEGEQVVISPRDAAVLSLEAATYRGSLRLVQAGSDAFRVVNELDMENYLAGVLPCELYAGWHDQTYRALAVAARTFALYHVRTTGQGKAWDLGSDQGSQVYGGMGRETPKGWAAVNSTRGKVLAADEDGQPRIFLAQYSAACGGHVNSASVLKNSPDISPLRGGQACDDCRDCPKYRWPTVRVSKADVYQSLLACYPAAAQLGQLAEIRVASSTSYGRPVWVDAIGRGSQSLRIRADDLRLALLRGPSPAGKQLYSAHCRISSAGDFIEFSEGKGFGHGVGICQWGAQGKALKGWSAQQILSFYYPGAVLVTLY